MQTIFDHGTTKNGEVNFACWVFKEDKDMIEGDYRFK